MALRRHRDERVPHEMTSQCDSGRPNVLYFPFALVAELVLQVWPHVLDASQLRL